MNLVQRKRINRTMASQIVDARVTHIFNTFSNVLFTSSFGTTSAVLLHIVNRIKPGYPIYFIDTGYHFEETWAYKERLSRLLSLQVITLKPDSSFHKITENKQMWNRDPDRCCDINKIQPVQRVKNNFDVWMSGLIGYQSTDRGQLEFLEDRSEILRFHPLIDWNKSLVDEYMEIFGLPRHPLEKHGYLSVGCTHCTVPGAGRSGRWSNSTKTECGLHS